VPNRHLQRQPLRLSGLSHFTLWKKLTRRPKRYCLYSIRPLLRPYLAHSEGL
jgi:hypothetical protein